MHVRLFALFAACAMGCVADGPLAGTDSPATSGAEGDGSRNPDAENVDKMSLSKAGATLDATSNTVTIDLSLGSTQIGFAEMTTISSSSHPLKVCSFTNSTGAGAVVVDVDPGSGILQQYTNSPTDPHCTEVSLGPVRKFRAFFWSPAPPPGGGAAIGLRLLRNGVALNNDNAVGSGTIGYPGGVPDIHVCTVPGFGVGTVAEIDPGNGVLAQYQSTGGCNDHNPGNSLRKFRAWFWVLPPPL